MNHLKYVASVFLFVGFISCCPGDRLLPITSTGSIASDAPARFCVAGNYLYQLAPYQVKIYGLTDPAQPVLVDSIALNGEVLSISADSNYLFVGFQGGAYVYTTDDPLAPQLVSTLMNINGSKPIIAGNGYLFAASDQSSLYTTTPSELVTIDISNPDQPVYFTQYLANLKGMDTNKDRLFVCNDLVKIYDITTVPAVALSGYTSVNSASSVKYASGKLIVVSSKGLYQYRYASDKLFILSRISIND